MKLILEQLLVGRDDLPVDETYTVEDRGEEVVVHLAGSLTVDNTVRRVVIHGELEVQCQAVCDRCLAACHLTYPAAVEIVILRAEQEDGESESEAWLIRQATGVVDLDDALCEAVALGRPLRVLCRDDCRGLCPHCGVDLNEQSCDCAQQATDPRWDALS